METSPDASGVIVADDDILIRNILRAGLEAIDQEVFLAYNGTEAVALAAKMQASLVILDVRMPKLNGVLACEQIRRLPGYAHTPIVMLTFDDAERVKTAATRAGATAFLRKPFGSASLMLALAKFLPIDDATLQAISGDADRAAGGKNFVKFRAKRTSS